MTIETLQHKFDKLNGYSTGFDYMRFILASLIILYHSYLYSYPLPTAVEMLEYWWRPFQLMLVPMFFALSGFLVAASYERSSSITNFLTLRVLRIFPALSVEVILSALLLGPLLTTFTLGDYFTDPLFYNYFWNILGHVSFHRPGMFAHNPAYDTVNTQLWTVPFELYCYVMLTVIALLGRRVLHPLIIAITIIGLFLIQLNYPSLHSGYLYAAVSGVTLILTFLSGVLIYRLRHWLPHSFWLFAFSLIVLAIILPQPPLEMWSFLPLTYVTVYLGMLNPKKIWIIRSGDYSYGLYLYSAAIQQAVISLSLGTAYLEWYWVMLISYPIALICAFCSWHLVERQLLGLRKHLHKPNVTADE